MAYQIPREYELLNPPNDGISGLAFNSQGLLLASSWDTVRETTFYKRFLIAHTKPLVVCKTL